MSVLQGFPVVPFILAAYLGTSGVRKRSLSPSGGIAAFIVGFAMMSVPLRVFGVSLIVFYLVGSKATKIGKERKAKLEDGHQEAGYRSASQVLCNSLSAFAASLVWSARYDPDSLMAYVFPSGNTRWAAFEFGRWCPVADLPPVWERHRPSRVLIFITLGHFACCLGDTLASELGILSKLKPRLITTLKPVPPGTNGGMSLFGTLASAAGGFIMGLTILVSLLIQSPACRFQSVEIAVPLLFWGTFAGVFGSLIDSLMGATIQRTRYSSKTKKILTDESSVKPSETGIQNISGFDLLTNNQVNLVSSIITAALLGYLAY